jgi:hypothetical protein
VPGATRRFDRWMTAVTLAEAGEPASALQWLEGERRVVLALPSARVARGTLRYAVAACQRLQATLDVLYGGEVPPEGAWRKRLAGEAAHAGVRHCLVPAGPSLYEAVVDHVRRHGAVAFVVLPASADPGLQRSRRRSLPAGWEALGCPLVLA